MCHYPAVIFAKIPAYTAPVSAPVSAPLHHRLRGRIAVASPSHRRIASAPHRIGAASHRHRITSLHETQALPTSLELHMPVVQPTRCTRTEEVDPQQRALGEVMMRTYVEVMVERL